MPVYAPPLPLPLLKCYFLVSIRNTTIFVANGVARLMRLKVLKYANFEVLYKEFRQVLHAIDSRYTLSVRKISSDTLLIFEISDCKKNDGAYTKWHPTCMSWSSSRSDPNWSSASFSKVRLSPCELPWVKSSIIPCKAEKKWSCT